MSASDIFRAPLVSEHGLIHAYALIQDGAVLDIEHVPEHERLRDAQHARWQGAFQPSPAAPRATVERRDGDLLIRVTDVEDMRLVGVE